MIYVPSDPGDQAWFKEGTNILHRVDGPAFIGVHGDQCWYLEGLRHRDGGPAVIRVDGEETWYQHGQRHRIGGPATIQPKVGLEVWCRYGRKHREDGPAVIWEGSSQRWYIDDMEIKTAIHYQELTGLSDEAMMVLLLKFNGF